MGGGGEFEGNERGAAGLSQTWLANWNHLKVLGGKTLMPSFIETE